MGSFSDGAWVWSLHWRRTLSPAELHSLDSLFVIIWQVTVLFGAQDRLVWFGN